MLKVKGIHTRSPNTSMKPNLSAIMSHLYKTIMNKLVEIMTIDMKMNLKILKIW